MEYENYVLSILSGLVVAIPLIVKLVEYVQIAVKERNWQKLLDLVMSYMIVAEEKFETGAERKEWVISMVQASAKAIDYPLDLAQISAMIDSLCSMTKKVNPPEEDDD